MTQAGRTSDVEEERRIRALHDLAARAGRPDRRVLLEAAAVELVACLESAGLPVLLLKGPALTARLYRPGEHRACTDVDVLLAPDNRRAAGAVLSNVGYENLSEREGVHDLVGILSAETWFRPYGVPVDLHWQLPGCQAPWQDVWRTLYEGRDVIQLAGRAVEILGTPGLALHVATHVAQHGSDDLKAMADLTRAIDRWPFEEWREAAGLAASVDATDAFAAGLRLVPEGAALAAELELPSTDRLMWKIQHRDARPRGTFHLEALSRARGLRGRVEVVRRSLFPTPAWIAWEYSTNGSRARLIIGYASHLARAPTWAARAWRYARQERRASRS